MLVSVLINNYNYGKYLDYCIQSVINQSYREIEIIVYDDGSQDQSLRILEKYNNQIKIIKGNHAEQPPTFNQANAISKAFEKSNGEIICLLDSDDAFCLDKVVRVVEEFKRNEEAMLVQHQLREINENNVPLENIRPPLKKVDNIKNYIQETNHIFNLFSTTSGLSFRRPFLKKVLPLKEDSRTLLWPDARLSFQAIFHGDVITILEPLSQYRIHSQNDSAKLKSPNTYSMYLEQKYSFYNEVMSSFQYRPLKELDQNQLAQFSFFYEKIEVIKVIDFIDKNRTKGKRVGIWGAGEAGRAIQQFITIRERNIQFFIDKDAKKIGSSINDVKVMSIDGIEASKDAIIISVYYSNDQIIKELIKKGMILGEDFIVPYLQEEV